MNLGVAKILLVFALLAVALNVDRLVLGDAASLKRTDVGDMYITKFEQGAAFWKDPQGHVWDASILRGSPIHLGSVLPQHLCCFLSVFLSSHLAFTIFQILIEFLVLTSSYLFFYNFLGYKHLTALYAAFFHLSMFYWFNENPYVTQTFLCILMVAAMSVGQRPLSRILRFFLLLVSLLISFPPYTVPLMPLVQLILVWAFSPKDRRAVNLLAWASFWAIFAIFYLPNLIDYFFSWGQSNRTLWQSQVGYLSLKNLKSCLYQMNLWFPCVAVLALFSFYKVRLARWLLLIHFFVLIIISQTNFLVTIPFLKTISFIWARSSYYSSILMLMVIAHLIDQYPVKITKKNWLMMGLWVVVGALALKTQWNLNRVSIAFIFFSVLSIAYVAFQVMQYAKTPFRILMLGLIFLLPFKVFYVKHYEDVPYAYLNNDPFQYQGSMRPYRVVTISAECWHPTFYPAQAQAKGQETFDGVSVFYNKRDAQYWDNFVIKNLDYCYFKNWNNRVEMIRAAWDENAKSIFKWVRLNNTVFIRSSTPIEYQGLTLQEHRTVTYPFWSKFFSPYLLETKDHYLYRIKDPISRVFAVESRQLMDSDGHVTADKAFYDSIDDLPVKNVDINAYAPSRLTWRGSFNGQFLLASINYHPHWTLLVDGQVMAQAVTEGPLGMLKIKPSLGEHQYCLIFKDNLHRNITASMMIGIFLLALFIYRLTQKDGLMQYL